MLFGRAASCCAFPGCRIQLVEDATETDDESVIGDICHIRSGAKDGPRFETEYPPDKIDKYENLILLCKNHHKIVDDQLIHYDVKSLIEFKRKHEEFIRSSLKFDANRQREDEIWAGYIQEWEIQADIPNWKGWTSGIFSGEQPRMGKECFERIERIRPWILSRIWPNSYPELKNALINFRFVLDDFCFQFLRHAEKSSKKDRDLVTHRFYKVDEWDDEKYKQLLKEYVFHVYLVEDLGLELTRAANWICELVRKYLSPSYRLSEGSLLIETGPGVNLRITTKRVEYKASEKTGIPYEGLGDFKTTRLTRDTHFGAGVEAGDSAYEVWDQGWCPCDDE